MLALLACSVALVGCKHHKVASNVIQARAPKPILLHATEQVTFRVKVLVHAATGGVLDTADGEGTRYRLTLPPGALPGDATITLTPLANIQGVPGQTRHYGVDIGPAGTILKQLARVEISPRQALPPHGFYWLETRGTPASMTAQLGFPAKDQAAIMLLHFSGATAVAGGVGAARAALQSIGDPMHVVEKYDGQRADAQSEYDAGHISREALDKINQLCDQQIQAEADRYNNPETILDNAAKNTQQEIDQLGNKVDQGNPDDLGAFQQAAIDAAVVDRQSILLLGKDPKLSDKIMDLFDRYYKGRLANCDKHPIPPEQLISMDRQAQLSGRPSWEGTPEYEKCMPKTLTASGGGDGLSVYGEAPNPPTKPFGLSGTFPGGNSTHDFTPTGPDGGTSTYTLSGSGVTGHGTGTYTIKKVGDNWVLVDTSYGCVDGIPNGCRNTTATITLTSHAAPTTTR